MRTVLHPDITTFEAFYKELVKFVHSGKPCYSVLKQKEYKSWMEGETIKMEGEDRAKDPEYTILKLKKVFEIIQRSDDIKTKMLDGAVKRDRSPILALMVASGVVIVKN